VSDTLIPPPGAPVGERSTVPTGPDGSRRYRYPGSPPFRDVDLDRSLFKGRDDEITTVFHSILGSDLFLLYSVSGLGKTSLLNAGVMQRLRDKGYWPVSVRFNDPGTPPVPAIEAQIRSAAAADDAIDLQRTFDPSPDTTRPESLWDLLGTLEVWRADRLQQLVLVLDQFEELFTLDWDPAERTRFIREFGEVVRGHRTSTDGDEGLVPNPRVKFVLVIREDALGELEALADDVPQLMQHRFRLGPLDRRQAEAAIREPAEVDDVLLDTPPFRYSEEAAGEILDFLQSAGPAARARGVGTGHADATIDPSQLQLICQHVERKVLPGKPAPPPGAVVEIAAGDLGGRDGLRRVLGDFYRQTMDSLPETHQRPARELCEEGLISSSRRRLSLEEGEIEQRFAVPAAVLHGLVDARLLRADPRVGSVYYELAHDTLVEPILNDRDERRAAAARRRQRRITLGATILAVAVGIVLVAWLVASATQDEAVREVPARPIGFGPAVLGSIAEPGAVERFGISDRAEPSLLVVRPTAPVDGTDAAGGLNVVVQLRRDGVQRQQDQLGSGQAERLVVQPLPDDGVESEVRVTSFDSTTGGFEIEWGAVEVTPLTLTSEVGVLTISEPGELAVFAVDGDADAPTEIVMTPVAPDGVSEAKLDVEVEVIDPSGIGRRVDANGSGAPETVTVAGPTGQHLVVVRGYKASTGQFTVAASAVAAQELSAGEPAEGTIDTADDLAEYTFDAPADRSFSVVVSPTEQFDPILEIVGPDGEAETVDTGLIGAAEFARISASGRHVLRVAGWEGTTGGFDITAAEVIGLEPGAPVVNTGVAVFEVEVAEREWFGATAPAEATTEFLRLTVFGPDDLPVAFGSAYRGESDVVYFGETAGTYEISVVPRGESPYSMALEPLELTSIEPGDEVTATDSTIFAVDVDAGERLEFTARAATADTVVRVQVSDPSGQIGLSASSGSGGAPASAIVGGGGAAAGTYPVVVVADGEGSFSASVAPIDALPLRVGETVEAAGATVFEVGVSEGELLEFTATANGPSPRLDALVVAPGPLPYSLAGNAGSDANEVTAIVGGFAGTQEVSVVAEGDTGFSATLTPVAVDDIELGQSVHASGGTAFDIEVDDRPILLELEPASAEANILAVVLDPDALFSAYATSLDTGTATVSVGENLVGDSRTGTHRVIVSVDGPPGFEARATAS